MVALCRGPAPALGPHRPSSRARRRSGGSPKRTWRETAGQVRADLHAGSVERRQCGPFCRSLRVQPGPARAAAVRRKRALQSLCRFPTAIIRTTRSGRRLQAHATSILHQKAGSRANLFQPRSIDCQNLNISKSRRIPEILL